MLTIPGRNSDDDAFERTNDTVIDQPSNYHDSYYSESESDLAKRKKGAAWTTLKALAVRLARRVW